LTLESGRPYAPVVALPLDDESFAAGRQALLDALQGLEQRAHDRAERTLREAEQHARQVILDSETHAQKVTAEAEARAERLVSEAEQRARQITLEAAQRVAELEQQLAEVRDNLESARSQLEEQFVAIHGMVEVARANLNTARERASSGTRISEPRGPARLSIPPLSSQVRPATPGPGPGPVAVPAEESALGATLNELRATVEGLKRPRRGERVGEPAPEPEGEPASQAEQEQPANR
jgi:multidrug efflux pump subunit AcrA (membrane-fusion protein)